MTHNIILGDIPIFYEYLKGFSSVISTDTVLDKTFDIGFMAKDKHLESAIDSLAPHCKVLLIPSRYNWLKQSKKYPSCQFVSEKLDLYRPQVQWLKDVKLMKNIIHDIDLEWDNDVGMIHMVSALIGPLSKPKEYENSFKFSTYGISVNCIRTKEKKITIYLSDSTVITYNYDNSRPVISYHNMIDDLFKLIKFNPSEYHKHFTLDSFVIKCLQLK